MSYLPEDLDSSEQIDADPFWDEVDERYSQVADQRLEDEHAHDSAALRRMVDRWQPATLLRMLADVIPDDATSQGLRDLAVEAFKNQMIAISNPPLTHSDLP